MTLIEHGKRCVLLSLAMVLVFCVSCCDKTFEGGGGDDGPFTTGSSGFATVLSGTSNADVARSLKIDSSDDIFIAGYTKGDLDGTNQGGDDAFFAKYSSSGKEEMSKQFGTSSNDRAYAIAIDASGNIYIAGSTGGDISGDGFLGGTSDAFIAKYSADGTNEWTKQFGSSVEDVASGMALDSSGNIYLVGHTEGDWDGETNEGGKDFFLVKYNASGTRQFTRLLGTASSSADDIAYCVALDTSSNVYIVGETGGNLDGETNEGGKDIFLVKYNSAGAKQFTKLLGTTGTADDEVAYAVTVNGSDVYIAGETTGDLDGETNAGGKDMFFVKYDVSGTRQFTRLLGTASTDVAYGVATDTSDNVYVAGKTEAGLDGNSHEGSADLFLTKYDNTGVKQWTQQLGTTSSDIAWSVDTVASDKIFLAGESSGDLDSKTNNGSTDYFIVRYKSSG